MLNEYERQYKPSSSDLKEWKIAEAIITLALRHKLDFTGDDDQWFKIGCSLRIFGQDGRILFNMLSQLRQSYTESKANAEYNMCLAAVNKIGFPSFIYYSRQVGIQRDGYMVFFKKDMIVINI